MHGALITDFDPYVKSGEKNSNNTTYYNSSVHTKGWGQCYQLHVLVVFVSWGLGF